MVWLLFGLLMSVYPNSVSGSDVSLWRLPPEARAVPAVPTGKERREAERLYKKLCLEGRLSFDAFSLGVHGYRRIADKKRHVLTVIDFSKPSTQERLFVFDMDREELLLATVCAHGRNSGGNYATSFSNRPDSHRSSLGFYLTGETYQGGNGYSLRLDGLEKGYNDLARSRAIVIHGAAYANEEVIRQGRLGRSFGCPAVPTRLARPLIDSIKGGSVLYIYADRPDYLSQSRISALPHPDAGREEPLTARPAGQFVN